MGLRPVACWDCVFESDWEHASLYLVNVVFSAGRRLCDGPIPLSEESYRLCVIEYDKMQQQQQQPSTPAVSRQKGSRIRMKGERRVKCNKITTVMIRNSTTTDVRNSKVSRYVTNLTHNSFI